MTREKILSVSVHDCIFTTFRSGGPGGQNRNKVNSAVRLVHPPSGAVGEAKDSRDQLHNKKSAFMRLINSSVFKVWLNKEIANILGKPKSIDEIVDEQMKEENLKVEFGPFN